MHILHSSFYRCRVVENNWILCRKVKSPSCSDQSDLNAPDVVITTRLLVSTNVRGGLERSISQGGNGGGHAHARFICSLDAEGCVSPLCSDCCARLLRDWPPVSAFGRERGSRQHPLLVEHSRPNCRVIRAFESPNTTKVSKNTSKSRWICRFWQKKKVARRMICLCYNQCLKWGKKVAVLSLHWQIITFLQWKTKLGDIAVTTIYCYLFINNINVFKHVCVCMAACVRVFHKN